MRGVQVEVDRDATNRVFQLVVDLVGDVPLAENRCCDQRVCVRHIPAQLSGTQLGVDEAVFQAAERGCDSSNRLGVARVLPGRFAARSRLTVFRSLTR